MKGFRLRLTKLINKCESHCGDDDLVKKSVDYEFQFADWLEGELEKMETKTLPLRSTKGTE